LIFRGKMTDKSIQRGLEQDARLVEEWMPDKLTKEAVLNVAIRLREFIDRTGFSQKKIGLMVGFKPSAAGSVISQFLKNEYKGDVKTLAEKLHQLMESFARRERRPKKADDFVKTSVAKAIFTLITTTETFSDDKEGKIGLIIGDSGHGKSRCLQEYSRANKNTIYVELDDVMSSKSIFAEIAKELKLDFSDSCDKIARRLIENLQNRHVIIILDEASRLSVRNLNLLRQIIVIKSRCPLILAGNRGLLNTVMQPTTRKACESLDQFTSRVIYRLDLDELANDKDGGLYTAEDIRQLYQYGGLKLTTDAIVKLRKIAKNPRSGRLQICETIISACHYSTAMQKRGLIDADSIISAIKQLPLIVKNWLPMTLIEAEEEEKEKAKVEAKAAISPVRQAQRQAGDKLQAAK